MLICLYHGKGKICNRKGGNVNQINVSMELLPQLRTWHHGKSIPGNVIPVILGRELPSEQYQFVIRESSIKIDGINYAFFGETGYIYAEKVDGQPLNFQEWSVSKIGFPVSGEGVYSSDPPLFEYLDYQPWDCYSNIIPDSPEYGQLAPVLDLSSNGIDFKKSIPQIYKNGAKLDLKITLQTVYTAY